MNSIPNPHHPHQPQAGGTTRREFLRTSATAVSAATLAGLDVARFAHGAGSDTLRVGMIGCGGRNTGAGAQALRADKGARLVALGDIFMERVKGAREAIRNELGRDQRADQVQAPDDHCFTGFDAYKRVIELSDVVCIANAAKFHPWHSMAAIQAGRHVFVEKPHGIDPAGVKLMQAACDLAKQKGLSLASGLHSRYHPGYAETVQRIHDGAIGDVVTIEENFLRAPYGVTERKPGLTELEWQCSTQYHFRWLSGDDVPQSLVHNMDRASWVLHNAVPIKCHGLGGRSSMTEPTYGDVFDHHSVVYEFPNGVRVYAFCRTTTGCYDESSSLIFGTKGRASLLECRIWGENQTRWRWQGQGDPYQIEHDRLFAGIRSGSPVNNGDYMARSTLITVAGQISCYTGKEVSWEQASASNYFHPPKAEDCRDGMEPPTKTGPDGSYPVPIPGRTRLLEAAA
ncbi:MAG: Gfo/Idh/MocA family oxidoreductase [Verrucomicrobia bacterium]|nr:Gfo/Idh/MocA family oxidoreductase [Verrucomicrobiota bacterium]